MSTPPAIVYPGHRATANRMNAAFLIGRVVFSATRDTSQSIASGVSSVSANALSWETIAVDVLGGFAPGSPTRYTPTIAGWYLLEGAGSFNNSTAGTVRGSGWLVNGSAPAASGARQHASSSIANTSLTVEARALPVLFNGTTDYAELAPFQDTGGALNTSTGTTRPYISVTYNGPA